MNDKSKYLIILGLNENATIEDVRNAADKIVSENQADLQSKEIDVRKYAKGSIETTKYARDELISILEIERELADEEHEDSSDDSPYEIPDADQLLENIGQHEIDLEKLKLDLKVAEADDKLRLEELIAIKEELILNSKELYKNIKKYHQPLKLVRLAMLSQFFDILLEDEQIIKPFYKQEDEDDLRNSLEKELPAINENKVQFAVVCHSESDANDYIETGKLKIFLLCWNGYDNTPQLKEYKSKLAKIAKNIGFTVDAPDDDIIRMYFSYKEGMAPDENDDEIQEMYDKYYSIAVLSSEDGSYSPRQWRKDTLRDFYDELEESNHLYIPHHIYENEEQLLNLVKEKKPELVNEKKQVAIVCISAADTVEYYKTGDLRVGILCLNGYELTQDFTEYRESIKSIAEGYGYIVDVPENDKTYLHFNLHDDTAEFEEDNNKREKQIESLFEILNLEPTDSLSDLQDQFDKRMEVIEDQLVKCLPLEKKELELHKTFFLQNYEVLEELIARKERIKITQKQFMALLESMRKH